VAAYDAPLLLELVNPHAAFCDVDCPATTQVRADTSLAGRLTFAVRLAVLPVTVALAWAVAPGLGLPPPPPAAA
jgi:hypothetical protein